MSLYTLSAPGVSFRLNKALIGIFNGTGSGQVVRVLRVIVLNNQTVAVTGVNLILELRRITTGSGGYAIAPIKHDSTNASVPSQIICATNMTYTEDANGSLFRRVFWSSDEPASQTANTIDEIETNPSLNVIWDCPAAFFDLTVEPIVLRPGYGLVVKNTTSTTVGISDLFIEFTMGTT